MRKNPFTKRGFSGSIVVFGKSKTYIWIDGLASKLQASLDFEGVERNSDLKHAKAWEMFVEVFVMFVLRFCRLHHQHKLFGTFVFLESKEFQMNEHFFVMKE